MAFDQENYFSRNRTDCIYLQPYKDYRQEPAHKHSRWPMFAVCGLAMVLVLVAVVAPT